MELAAQIISIGGMIFNLISFQQKVYKRALLCQMFSTVFFGISYFMLGATVGGILNIVAMIRSVVFLFKEKTRADNVFWMIFFIVSFILSYPAAFLLFGKEPSVKNLVTEIFPIIAMTLATVSIRIGSTKAIRWLGLFASPLWLTYNICSLSLGATLCEILNLISITVGIIRFDRKDKK